MSMVEALRRFLGRTHSPAGPAPLVQPPAGEDVDKLGLLEASELFRGLNDDQMAEVDRMTVMTRCDRGNLLYAAEDKSETLFLLKRGKVSLYRLSPDGKKLTIAVISPGTLFGNMEFTGSTLAGSFAEASEDSILCVIKRPELEALIVHYPIIGIRLVTFLSRRLRDIEARLEEGLLRDMQARVAAALLRLSREQGAGTVHVTHQELADSLGTYRETVTATLGALQDGGLISLERTRIQVLDAPALRRIVAHRD